ncbi:ABZJ_00895 family protein [Acinetobacter sp. MD2]|uniref:ABZJ_00895 family protein n=1 Tax=Acinetobacter sp. MD2 TaxID=2600066 RepID=UPI002D1F305E|nr:ABZJ_00895 family protein [Acinetobacter sp. MD2]MEB3768035.1 hypothetical protein [Acinetobacter sp. MD2]
MTSLRPYFGWFLLISFITSSLISLMGLIIPHGRAGFLTAFPYLIAMIAVLLHFLKKERRAPTSSEKYKFTWGFLAIFWSYSFLVFFVELVWNSKTDEQVYAHLMAYVQHPKFFFSTLGLFLFFGIPLYLVTLWFYGKLARRMVHRMHEENEIE